MVIISTKRVAWASWALGFLACVWGFWPPSHEAPCLLACPPLALPIYSTYYYVSQERRTQSRDTIPQQRRLLHLLDPRARRRERAGASEALAVRDPCTGRTAIRFLGSVYATAQSTAAVRLPQAGSGGFLLPGGKIVFILYIMEVGQGSGSSERMGGYDPFIFLLCFVFLFIRTCCSSVFILLRILSWLCFICSTMSFLFLSYICFWYKIYVVSLVKLKRFICCCLYVSLVIQSRRLIYCFSYVSVVLFHRLTCSLLFIAILRYMSCLVIIFHILCFYIFNNHMFYMFMDHMFYIPMNMFNIMISMINYIIYVIIIMLIYGIKMIWKLPIILTI